MQNFLLFQPRTSPPSARLYLVLTQVTLKDRHSHVTVNFLKHQVFFTAKIKYPDFPDHYLAGECCIARVHIY